MEPDSSFDKIEVITETLKRLKSIKEKAENSKNIEKSENKRLQEILSKIHQTLDVALCESIILEETQTSVPMTMSSTSNNSLKALEESVNFQTAIELKAVDRTPVKLDETQLNFKDCIEIVHVVDSH